ncbi:MAG: WD40 repeat domain-containing protein, partial [Chitinophagaceae bacterium]
MKQKQPGIFFKGVIMLFCWLLSVETSAQQPQLVVPLAHHRAPYVQLNAAGDLLLSEEDQLLLLWDVNYRRVRYNLSIPGRRLINSTFSPGGYELLIVTDDSAAQLLDLRTGSVIRKFALAGTKLVYGTFSGDGRSVVTAHSDSSIVRWELSRPAPVLHRKWGGLPHLVVADATGEHVFIQHDSTYVDESTGDLIKVRRAALLHFASNRRRPISGFVSFIPARNAVLRFEYVARLEDVNSGRLLLQIPLSFNGAYCLSLDKKYVAMGDNFEISVWNLALGKREQKQTVAIESGIITELQLHAFADSNRRILASYDNEVQSVNWRARRSVFTGWDTLRLLVDQDGLAPQGFAVNRDAHRIAASYASGRIRVFNLADLRFPALLEGYSEPVNDLLYDKRFHRLFSRHGYKNIKCWDLSRMRLDYTIADTTFCGAANAFRLCSDEKNLFIDVCEGFEGYYDVATGKSLPIDSVGDDCRRALRVTSNGTRLQKGYVQGWSIMAAQTDSVVRMIDTSGFVKQAFLSPGGDLLVFTTTVLDASGNDNGIDVQLVDLLKGDTVRLLQSAFNLEEVHFGARRQLIVITKDQGTLLFDLPSATRRYLGEFRSAAFISDSVLALSSLSDIVLYHLPQQRVQAQLLALQNDDFLVLLPNGYYSAHLRNLGKLHYTKNGKIVSFEQLDLRYNRPDKVLEALGSTDTLLIAAYRNAHLKRMQRLGIDTAAFGDAYAAPDGDFVGRERIAAQQRGKTLALRYRAADSVSTIAGFNVWINEVPLFGAKGITLTGNRSTFDTTIRIVLSRGENR